MKKFVDYYKVLGLRPKADAAEIRAAYVRLAKEHHPDKGGDPGKMNLVNEAYDTLKNPLDRAQFDRRFDRMKEPVRTVTQQPAPRTSQPSSRLSRVRMRQAFLILITGLVVVAAIAWFFMTPGRQSDEADNNSTGPQSQDELQNLKAQYDACVESFDQATNRLALVNRDLNVAKLNGDTAGYNALIPAQNQMVADYNARRAECNSLKNQYNEQVNNFNETTIP